MWEIQCKCRHGGVHLKAHMISDYWYHGKFSFFVRKKAESNLLGESSNLLDVMHVEYNYFHATLHFVKCDCLCFEDCSPISVIWFTAKFSSRRYRSLSKPYKCMDMRKVYIILITKTIINGNKQGKILFNTNSYQFTIYMYYIIKFWSESLQVLSYFFFSLTVSWPNVMHSLGHYVSFMFPH